MKFLKACFHNKDTGLDLKIGGIISAANPGVCSHHSVHNKDGCGSVHWTELAQGNPIIGSCEHIYSWIFSFVYYFKKCINFKINNHFRSWKFFHH
jgi:hypothetical protein